MRKLFLRLIITVGIFVAFPLVIHAGAEAAQVYPSPASGSHYVGNTFTVGIFINTTDPVNAAETSIAYDTSRLSIQSCSSGGSGFNTPIPTATTGCTNITAGSTTPFTGNGGQIGSITFLVTNEGTANVSVSGAAANNGSAVSTTGGSGSYTLSVYVPPDQPPGSVTVSSASHPKQDQWYNLPTVALSWNKETGVTGFSYVFDQKKSTVPLEETNTTGTGVDIEFEQEGIWYFHIRARSNGGWGTTTHFTVRFDSTPPEITESELMYMGDLRPELTYAVSDALSGVVEELLSVNGGSTIEIESPYKSGPLSFGNHSFILSVSDAAGNTSEKEFTITIGSISPPLITEFGFEQLYVGSVSGRLKISGTAPSGSIVFMFINPGGIVLETRADDDGNWEYIFTDALAAGAYEITTQSQVDSYTSESSEALEFNISRAQAGLLNLPLTGGSTSPNAIWIIAGGIGLGLVSLVGLIIVIRRYRFKKQQEELKAAKSQNGVFGDISNPPGKTPPPQPPAQVQYPPGSTVT